jgi:putative ABC transport system ATP-binding protein
VACRDVHVDYVTATGVVQALRGIDVRFAPGRVNVLAGPSGSGKSSMLRVLAGLQRPRSGRIEVAGTDIVRLRAGPMRRLRRRHIGVVLQDPADNLIAYLTAAEQLVLAARLRGVDPGEATGLLAAAGLADRSDSRQAELSGGEQQRVAFAAAAIGRPALLLADEPTAELDATAGARLVDTVRDLAARGSTVVATSHDPVVIDAADHVVDLRDGRVVDR